MRGLPNHENTTSLAPDRAATIRSELNAILKSRYFSGSKRCQDFLEYIVQQALEGNVEYLTERFLGAELFGRPINYDTGADAIVRVRANDVRRRLSQYYSEASGAYRVIIDLSSGTYVPEFRWQEPKPTEPAAADSPPHELLTSSSQLPDRTVSVIQASLSESKARSPLRWVFISLITVIAIGSCIALWPKQQSLNRALYPLRYSPSMQALWSNFFSSGHETDIVLSDASFQLLQDISKQRFTLNDYLNRSYLSRLRLPNTAPNMGPVLDLIASKNFGNSSEFRLAERIVALDPPGSRIHVYNSRDYSSSLAAQDNMVLIGSQYTNPWEQLFDSQLNFMENPPGTSPGVILNKEPKTGESATYSPTDAIGYCVVAYLPIPDHNTDALLIEGSSSEATEAGGDFLLSEDRLADFKKMFHSTKLPYFEALLKTSQVRGTPITATVEAYRVIPSQH